MGGLFGFVVDAAKDEERPRGQATPVGDTPAGRAQHELWEEDLPELRT